MVRWRNCLVLALLLLLPLNTLSDDDDGEDEGGEEADENEDGDDADDDNAEKPSEREVAPKFIMPSSAPQPHITRTLPRRPLECYVCSYKADAQLLKSCLDPSKYRTHTMACHSVDDKCFTSVLSKNGQYEAVMRGCRSSCVSTPETTCCDMNRCNNQAMALPVVEAKPKAPVMPVADTSSSSIVSYKPSNKANKTIPPSVLFFVTILLVLQTVVKVAVV